MLLRARSCDLFMLIARTSLVSLFAVCVSIFGLQPPAWASETQAGGYSRPDPAQVRAEVQNILSEPRFAPRKTVWQWLTERFTNWEPHNLNLPSGLITFVVWMLFIWCGLAILAILAHTVWTLSILIGRGRSPADSQRASLAERVRQRSWDELSTMMQRLAERGEYREALGVMMLATLKLLDKTGAVRFHESKTNGEYVLEYASERPGREHFRRFVAGFEGTIYGGQECEPEVYLDMYQLFEHICAHAEQKPQV